MSARYEGEPVVWRWRVGLGPWHFTYDPPTGMVADEIQALYAATSEAEGSGAAPSEERRCIIPARFDDRRQFNKGRSCRRGDPRGDNERSYRDRRRARTAPTTATEP